MTTRLRDLPGLGPKTEQQLISVGITTPTELIKAGAIAVFQRLIDHGDKPSLNFLYALVGAIHNQHWQTIAKTQKQQLLYQLDGYQALLALFAENNTK